MSIHQAYIVNAATEKTVAVELHDDLKADVLLDIDDQWTPFRLQIRKTLETLGIPRPQWPQSLHWDWGRKSLTLAFGDPDDFRVMAIKRQKSWEAAIVTLSKDHAAALSPDAGKPLIYIDYLETAPWNWTVDKFQQRKFAAVGPVLLRAAIEQSYAKEWAGRVGLHALPQASGFYQGQGFRFVRNDPDKQNLPYYELTAAEAETRTGRRESNHGT